MDHRGIGVSVQPGHGGGFREAAAGRDAGVKFSFEAQAERHAHASSIFHRLERRVRRDGGGATQGCSGADEPREALRVRDGLHEPLLIILPPPRPLPRTSRPLRARAAVMARRRALTDVQPLDLRRVKHNQLEF